MGLGKTGRGFSYCPTYPLAEDPAPPRLAVRLWECFCLFEPQVQIRSLPPPRAPVGSHGRGLDEKVPHQDGAYSKIEECWQ